MRDFDGTHPTLRQSPPSKLSSISATLAPTPAAPADVTKPAAPAPITTKSYLLLVFSFGSFQFVG